MRARSIKPGFFKNEDIAECSPFARLLFPGLWMLADREGKIEYRPKRIKAEVFPFDDVDVSALVGELETHGMVKTYTVNGAAYLWIIKFLDHQRPHQNESESIIPNYISVDEGLATMVQSASPNGESTSLLIPSSLIPSSRFLDIPSTPSEPREHTRKPKEPKAEKPNACPPEQWDKYVSFSRKFHEAKHQELGAMADVTEKKILDGARALDNLVRVRGIDSATVQSVIMWSMEDGFWRMNLRALTALTNRSSNGDTKFANILASMHQELGRG